MAEENTRYIGSGPKFEFDVWMRSIALETETGNLLVGTTEGVVSVNALTGDRKLLELVGGGPLTVIVVGPDGAVFTAKGGSLIRNGTEISGFSRGNGPSLGSDPTALALEANGNVIVGSDNFLTCVDQSTGDRKRVTDDVGALVMGLAVQADGSLVMTDSESRVSKVNPKNGDRETMAIVKGAAGIAVQADRSLAVVSQGLHAVVRVVPDSGNITTISGSDRGNGQAFAKPYGIAIEAEGILVVTDTQTGTVLRVDEASGERTVVSGQRIA